MFPFHFISLPLALALLATAAKSQVCPTQTVFSSDRGFNNRTFSMALHVAPPFVSYNKEASGSSRFSGLTIDIARLLENELSCKFEFMLADGNNPESSGAAVLSVVSHAGSSPQAQVNIRMSLDAPLNVSTCRLQVGPLKSRQSGQALYISPPLTMTQVR